MQDATVVMIFLNWEQILFCRCVKKNHLRATWKGICLCQLSVSVVGCLLATCHLIIHCVSMGCFVGGGTWVSARVGLLSMLGASDMEQRLSKGLAHLSV